MNYCEGISDEDFVKENSSFGKGSIRNLLVHTAATYQYWIGKCCLKREMVFTEREDVNNFQDIREVMPDVDDFMEVFFTLYEMGEIEDLSWDEAGKTETASPFKLFTHVITHEFHHKGQILSLSRHLGYTPIDTDVML